MVRCSQTRWLHTAYRDNCIGPTFGEFKTDYESIFERMARAIGRKSTRSAVVDHENPGVMHGAKASTSVACKNDEEVAQGLLDVIQSHDFTFGRFKALADIQGCKSIYANYHMILRIIL
jgi:RNA exonuclease 1